jgi:hypothetical protein
MSMFRTIAGRTAKVLEWMWVPFRAVIEASTHSWGRWGLAGLSLATLTITASAGFHSGDFWTTAGITFSVLFFVFYATLLIFFGFVAWAGNLAETVDRLR